MIPAVSFGALLTLILAGWPIAAALAFLALAAAYILSPMPLHLALGDFAWQSASEFLLVAIPLFILMGEILLRSGIAQRLYAAIVLWTGWLPGGLMHSNIASCTLFAATSGSSVATAATIGTVAIPEAKRYGYNEPLFLGTLAAGGTIGILIPPSVALIIYGLLTNTSVPDLYIAGFIPGLVLMLVFMATVLAFCMVRPAWGGKRITATWSQRLSVLPDILLPGVIFVVVIGSIYAGFATPTEASALGVVCSLLLAAFRKTLSLTMLRAVVEGTLRTTGMIMIIVLAAGYLNFVLASVGLTREIEELVTASGLSPAETLAIIIAIYLILGCVIEVLSLLLITTPILAPIVFSLGYDPIWFGILLMVLMEAALITPPVGLNLYVVHGVRHGGSMNDVIVGSLPFVLSLFVMAALLIAFPEIALWLPEALR